MYPVLVDCLSVCVWGHLIHGMTVWDHLIHGMSQYQTTWYGRWLIVQDHLLYGSTQCETQDAWDGCLWEITWYMGWLNVQDYLSYGLDQCEFAWHMGRLRVWDHLLLHKPGTLSLTLGRLKRSPVTSIKSFSLFLFQSLSLSRFLLLSLS